MSTGAFDQSVRLLKELSREELLRLASQAKALASVTNGSSNGGNNGRSSANDFVLQTVFDSQKALGIGGYFQQLTTEAARPETRSKIEELVKFLTDVDPDRRVQILVLTTGIKALVESLRWMSLPVTGAVLLRHIHEVPALLDKHYPGYARFGLMRLLLRSGGRL